MIAPAMPSRVAAGASFSQVPTPTQIAARARDFSRAVPLSTGYGLTAGGERIRTSSPTVLFAVAGRAERRFRSARRENPSLLEGGTDGSNPLSSSGESSELPYCAAGSSDLVEHQAELLISLPRGSSDPPFSNTCLATVRDARHAENAVTHAEGPKGWTDLSANLDQAVTCRVR